MKGMIFSIKRFAVHDGPGIRTTVFFKGCPLRCRWCHNPEGLTARPQATYDKDKCIGCMECTAVCPSNAQREENGRHIFERKRCIACGRCESVCLGRAIAFYGQETDAEELCRIAGQDRAFFDSSGGGVTVSGGEPLLQAEFVAEFLNLAKSRGLRTAVDTCGAVPRAAVEQVLPYTDLFLFDVKHTDPQKHREGTGKTNGQILQNLRFLDDAGAKTEIRYPLIPGFNDDESALRDAADLFASLKNATGVRILPYHFYAGSKYRTLGMKDRLAKVSVAAETLQRAKRLFAASLPVAD